MNNFDKVKSLKCRFKGIYGLIYERVGFLYEKVGFLCEMAITAISRINNWRRNDTVQPTSGLDLYYSVHPWVSPHGYSD